MKFIFYLLVGLALQANNSYAGVYFLPDYQLDYGSRVNNTDTADEITNKCKDFGELESCPFNHDCTDGRTYQDHYNRTKQCHIDNGCKVGTCDFDNNGNCTKAFLSCTIPDYLDGECVTNNIYYARCTEDLARACSDTGHTSTSCPEDKVVDTYCPYDPNYMKCKCKDCSGYKYSKANANATGYVANGSCTSCGVTTYKRKDNPCTGYTECGKDQTGVGAPCYKGTIKSYSSCNFNCTDTPCDAKFAHEENSVIATGYIQGTSCTYCGTKKYEHVCANKCTLDKCPTEALCIKEACSNKFCITGCALKYTFWCTPPIIDCAILGYSKTKTECPNGIRCPYGEFWSCI